MRLEGERACILVIIGATADGDNELLAVHDGVRESEQSWKEVLLDLKERGLRSFRQRLPGEVSEGRRVPHEGSRRAPVLLRLPCRALAASAHHQPDRIDLRNGAAADQTHQGLRLAGGHPHHGLQARARRPAVMAQAQRPPTARGRDSRRPLHRWHQGDRRLIRSGFSIHNS